MIVVTVARRPLSEANVASNVLLHGTGPMNIEACRIAHDAATASEASDPSRVQRQGAEGVGAVGNAFGAGGLVGSVIATYKPSGRWPANLLLGHLEGCRQEGTTTVKSNGHYPAARPAGSTQYTTGHGGQSGLVEHHMGDEAVPAWLCAPGCPVADLDAQSGDVPTGSWVRHTDGPHPFGNAVGSPHEKWMDVAEPLGGASRYFKQFGGRK